MPKVSSFYVKIDNELLKVDIHYNQKKKFHITSFNDNVLSITDERLPSHIDTEDKLKNHIHGMVNAYHDKTANSKKVIGFKLFGSNEITMNKVDDHSFSGRRKGIYKTVESEGEGYSIGFEYLILLETTKNGKRYNEINSDGSIGYDRDYIRHKEWIIIDWTAEREEAFKQLAEGMYNLMVKICSALGDEHKAIQFIDSKVKLLN